MASLLRRPCRVNPRSLETLGGLTVLLVEDVDALRELARLRLELEGAAVVEARTGREACELADQRTFDVVLTDLGLPDIHGEAVIRRVRASSRGRTPVAVVSGAGSEELSHAVAVGAERAFCKPVDWDELIAYLVAKAGQAGSPSHGA